MTDPAVPLISSPVNPTVLAGWVAATVETVWPGGRAAGLRRAASGPVGASSDTRYRNLTRAPLAHPRLAVAAARVPPAPQRATHVWGRVTGDSARPREGRRGDTTEKSH